ncbi:terpene synthase family protein [Streptomyces sp. NPDC060085]|uniref:terpene synthase family protein n=1 Tax=Streptomyces sp. NPDC060085 TaxID=3347054 RepID=UPI003659B8F4
MTTNTSLLADPERLSMPFRSRVSADVDRARTHHLNWIAARGLWPSARAEAAYRAADFPLFAASVYPWARGEDLDLLTDLLGWAWLWDDSLDRPGPRQADVAHTASLLNVYRNVLHGRMALVPSAPLADAWHQLLQRLEERTSKQWRQLHAALWEATYASFLQEARNNAAGSVPSFQEYLSMRREAGGPSICFIWAEAAGRYEVPAHVYASEDLQTLDQAAEDVVIMTNDLFSVSNEWSDGNTNNIILVLAQQENCSWHEAARRAEDIINTTMVHFQDAESHFLSSHLYQDLAIQDRANTDRFLDVLKAWMSGSLNWHRSSARYQSTNITASTSQPERQ